MTKIYFFICILIFSGKLSAQIAISGQIIDTNNKPIEFLEVQLQNKDSIILKSELTNNNGKFTILIEKGEYLLLLKQLGKILLMQKVNAIQNINLGIINVKEVQVQLKEVIVNAKKKLIERKIDRLIFNVENSISAIGGDAIDALKMTPGVRVQNDNIAMIGKSKLAVMIDDRLIVLAGADLTNFLKTIKSDDIKLIEVITNPSAKYDAEGNSGIINIKIKKSNANSWSTSIRSSYQQATYGTANIGSGFNYQKNNITLSTNFNYTNGANKPVETEKINYPSQIWNNYTENKNYSKSLAGKLAFDYRISSKMSVGFQYFGSTNAPKISGQSSAVITEFNTNKINQIINTNLDNLKKINNHSLNLHTVYLIDTIGRKLLIDIDYFNFKRTNNQIFATIDQNFISNTLTLSSINNLGSQSIQNYVLKLDMEHPLKNLNMSYGTKFSSINNASNIDFFDLSIGLPVYDKNQSNNFLYKEKIQSCYFSIGQKFYQEVFELQIGFRFEATQTEGFSLNLNQTNNNNYNNLFPSLALSYTPNQSNSFSVDYTKRINRPKYSMLNPFRIYINPYSYIEGNPFLQPSNTHNFSLNYTFKENFNSSFYYSIENNGFAPITFITQSSINQITTNLNFFESQNIGLNESYNYNKIKGWESYNSANISYSKTTSKNTNIQTTEGFASDLSSNNTFTFNEKKTFFGSFNFSLQLPSTYLNTKNQSVFNTDIAVKYLLLKKQLIINFVFTDVFKSNKQKWTQAIDNTLFSRTNYEDAQTISFSLSYKFGNSKLKIKDAKIGNSEEKRRATGG